MPEENTSPKVNGGAPLTGLSRKQVLLLWLVLTLALAPGIYFIRAAALEVTRYQVDTFEPYAREALAQGAWDRVIELCTGAMKSGVNRNDHWGKVFSLRAQAYAGQGNREKALTELEAAAAFWIRHYYYAKEEERAEAAALGTSLANAFLENGNPQAALKAVSAGGLASGRPVEYLEELAAALPPEQRQAMWAKEPYLLLREFRTPEYDTFATIVEEQGRALISSTIDPAGSQTGGACALLEVGEGAKEGRSWFGIDAYLPIAETAHGLRVYVREESPAPLGIFLAYWFESSRKSANTEDNAAQDLGNGWKCYDIARDFYAERSAEANQAGYMVSEGIVNKIGLSFAPGAANRVWVDRIELYLRPAS